MEIRKVRPWRSDSRNGVSGEPGAVQLLAAGENPKVVSERLGHATVAFTLDRYAHVLPGMQEQASGKLEAILFGG